MQIAEVQTSICQEYGIPLEQLKATTNRPAVVQPRQVAMYLARLLTDASLAQIGRAFGGKHHTTVLHSIRKIRSRLDRDTDLQHVIARLLTLLCGIPRAAAISYGERTPQ